jgi:hypothetical protein
MLAYVPVTFDVYRPLKPRHRWAMQCLVSFADHSGRCFPSIRAFAAQAGISKSVAQRDLAACAAAGYFTRERRPGGVYVYQIAERFLPRWPVSQKRSSATQGGVPPRGSRSVPVSGHKEKPLEEKEEKRFAKSGMNCIELPDYDSRWPLRLQNWQKSGFWLLEWGPKPTEPGCYAPPALLRDTLPYERRPPA